MSDRSSSDYTTGRLFTLTENNRQCFTVNNIHEKKLLNSDLLRAVPFKCNTSAKSVECKLLINHKLRNHRLRNDEIVDYGFKKDLPAFPPCTFFFIFFC